MTYFLDTNVIIDLLNGNSNILASFKNAYTFDSVKIPDLVYYEVLRGFEYSDPKKAKKQALRSSQIITVLCIWIWMF